MTSQFIVTCCLSRAQHCVIGEWVPPTQSWTQMNDETNTGRDGVRHRSSLAGMESGTAHHWQGCRHTGDVSLSFLLITWHLMSASRVDDLSWRSFIIWWCQHPCPSHDVMPRYRCKSPSGLWFNLFLETIVYAQYVSCESTGHTLNPLHCLQQFTAFFFSKAHISRYVCTEKYELQYRKHPDLDLLLELMV